MEPVSVFSILTGAASLAMQCAQVAKFVHDLRGKFKDAHLTIVSAMQELNTVRVAWKRIEQVLRTWEDSNGADTELLQQLSQQIHLGVIILTALCDDLLAIEQKPSLFRQRKKLASFDRRARIVWNEDLLKAHQDRIRGQAIAMNLLLSVIQL